MMTENQNGRFNIYLEKVLDEQDKILFSEAVKSANLYMYRSAYIMAWLTCMESLKRKFDECAKYGDEKAIKNKEEIKEIEKKHGAADKKILELSKEYGLINESEYEKLLQHYVWRSVYAHPYKEAPSYENVLSEFSDISDIILARPVLFTENYIHQLINKLNNNLTYLNDYEMTVKEAAKDWIKKIKPDCFVFLLETYSKKIEKMCKTVEMEVFIRRAKWFIEQLLKNTDYNIYKPEEWHDFIIKYPNFSINLAINNKDFFLNIGERAQDYLISKILEIANYAPRYLQILAPYLEDKDILRDNYSKIISKINSLSLDALKSSGLKLKYYVSALLNELESFDYYRQNPTITLIQENEQNIATLDLDQQFKLGELIHKAAHNNAWYAKDYINKIVSNPNEFPLEFLRGICSIIIEDSSVRKYIYFREELLQPINLLINNLGNNTEIVNYVNSLLNRYANNELAKEEYTLEEIENHLHVKKYAWIELNTGSNN